MKFFFDNNLAPKVARGLHAFVQPEHQVVHLKDRFAASTEDEVWMKKLAEDADWIIITADIRISKNPYEIRAWKEAGHTIVFLKPGWTDMSFWVQVNKFTKCFPEIMKKVEKARRGSSFMVSVNGKVEG
ncbi:MAG TPA: DUF5615 family PIN-like protein [Chitinophagaceae bacterium]